MSTIVYIHGIGRSKKSYGYSDKMQEKLGDDYKHIEFSWQSHVEEDIDKFFNASFEKPKWRHFKRRITYFLRKLLFDYVVDAVVYLQKRSEIRAKLREIMDENENVTFICHSLGALIAHDFMHNYGTSKVDRYITLGCNLPLFFIGAVSKYIPVLSSDGWVNYYEPNDILSMRIAPIKLFLSHEQRLLLSLTTKDVKFEGRHLFKSHSVAAHNSYWRSNKLIRMIKAELKRN